MHFTKIQAAGNDYVLVETADNDRNWSKTAVAMLDRHYGIGADGLLLMLPSNSSSFKMRIFNADGSESEACGNGLRSIVRYYIEKKQDDPETGEIAVETMAGMRKATFQRTDDNTIVIQTGMGVPEFTENNIPVIIGENRDKILDINGLLSYPLSIDGSEYRLNLVSMGNPHAVYFTDTSPADFPLEHYGPEVEKHQIFPEGTNFEVAKVINRKLIEVRVWERGVGETLACGSGACAVAVAARLHNFTDNKVEIKMPGGILEVEWDGMGEVFLSGPAITVFSGEWPDG